VALLDSKKEVGRMASQARERRDPRTEKRSVGALLLCRGGRNGEVLYPNKEGNRTRKGVCA